MTILIRGKFLGARNREYTNSQGSFSFYEIGVENSRPDGWAAHSQFRQLSKYLKKLVDSGILNRIASLQGKTWRSQFGLMPMSVKMARR
jgi:predicted metal-dependent RNase